MSRPSRLFRGSEFPRWLLLFAIMVVGWVLVVQFVRAKQEAPPPPPLQLAADIPPPIPPDEGIEFAALRDRAPLTARDNPAYAELLRRARETPLSELVGKSRRDVSMAHLYDRPELYRAVPIHIAGTAIRVVSYEVGEGLSPKQRLYEAWVITPDSASFPYCVIFENPPKDLALGTDLDEPVVFDGYFLKLWAYEAAHHKGRSAPLLVGRLRRTVPHPTLMAPAVKAPWLGGVHWMIPVLAMLMLVSLGRWFFVLRKNFAPARRVATVATPNDQIDPESLADWLNKGAEEDEEEERFGHGDDA